MEAEFGMMCLEAKGQMIAGNNKKLGDRYRNQPMLVLPAAA